MAYCISVDWLQIYGIRQASEISDVLRGCGRTYSVRRADSSTKLWKDVYHVYSNEREVAVFCCSPRTPQISSKGCSLKLDNRVLYSRMYLTILYELMDLLHIQYIGITRLDLCYDCNELAGGRDVSGFLMDYFTHAPYCAGHIIRSGSRKCIVNATRSANGATCINAMRWGSPSSDIGAYCYNKSLELLEVKYKPWIVETWAANGLIHNVDEVAWGELTDNKKKKIVGAGETSQYIAKSVWRFELSIKSHAKDILNLDTGELFKLSPEYLSSQARVENLFYIYAAKVFDFRMSTGQQNIRNYPPLRIFEEREYVSERPVNVSLYADTGRTERMIINKLEKMKSTYSDITSVQITAIESTLQFIREIAGCKRGLTDALKSSRFLDSFKATTTRKAEYSEYLDYLRYVHDKRVDVSAEETYDFFTSLYDALRDEDNREYAKGFISSVSPVY